MKTTILICIVLLFGFTVSAQDTGTRSELPYASFNAEKMNTDYNDPYPWGVAVTNDFDYNDPHPWGVYVSKNIPLDAPVTGWATQNTHDPKPPVYNLPNSKNRDHIKVRKPACCIY